MTEHMFHVHTYRCQHASDEPDYAYIEKAISLHMKSITFTDHAPFPGDPFRNRMQMQQLSEYVEILSRLREQYAEYIDVHIGLEVEYLPSFRDYYEELTTSGNFDLLILGQHFYEIRPGEYSFMLPPDKMEYQGLAKAVIAGIQSGYFQVVAHPDRIFRRAKEWTEDMEAVSRQIIEQAEFYGIPLEQNLSSMKRKNQYRPEFWTFVSETTKQIVGFDAHSTKEIESLFLIGEKVI